MSSARVNARLMGTYLAEMAEHVLTCNRELAAIERGSASADHGARFDTLCRTTHSLKGASQAVQLGTIETACHLFEEALLAARGTSGADRGGLFHLLYDTVDALADAHSRLTQGASLTGAPIERIITRLAQMTRAQRLAADAATEPEPAPRPAARTPPPAARSTQAAEESARAPARIQEEPPQPALGVSFRELCDGFEKMAHDLADATGKALSLEIEGGEQRLDPTLASALKDPLRHLIRNAIDHGTEAPAERRHAGKPSPARIVTACQVDDTQITVSVMDDGRGIDTAAVQAAAQRLGLPAPTSTDELLRLLCRPGFTTAARVSTLSGRGTGLDAVRSRLDELDGALTLSHRPGLGTRFEIRVPHPGLRQGVLRVIAGGTAYALPIRAVESVIPLRASELRTLGGRAYRLVGERSLPVAVLDLLVAPGTRVSDVPVTARPRGIVVESEASQAVVAVDSVGALERVVIAKSDAALEPRSPRVGSFVDGEGVTVTVLDPAEVVARARHATWSEVRDAASSAPGDETDAPRILVAASGTWTRELLRRVLERAAYRVSLATTTSEAARIVAEGGASLLVAEGRHPDGPTIDWDAVRRANGGSESPMPVVILAQQSAAEPDESSAWLSTETFRPCDLTETVKRLLGRFPARAA